MKIHSFLLSILGKPTREFLEFVKWNDDDAIAHYPLRIRITNLTLPNFTLSQGIVVGPNFIPK
jgi:hypothetical protein